MANSDENSAPNNQDARNAMLTKIRRVQATDQLDAKRRQAVLDRLKVHPRNIVPKRGDGDTQHHVELFTKMMQAANTSVEEVATPGEIPGAVSRYLRSNNLPQRIRHGKDPALTGLAWSKTPSLERSEGRARISDEVSLSRAFAAVAESGTLVLASGQDNPTTLNFLPENHIVVVEAGRISGNYEDTWDQLRRHYGEAVLPRTVNFISGPSRTGDIEQRMELGAHGPRRLHVIILNPESTEG
ncbi:MAG: LutC/YkgG family protein [Hyphomicrobiales bacterium]